MSLRVVTLAAAALTALAAPASATEPQPVLSHDNLDRLENDMGWIGFLGLLGLLGLRRRDKRD